MDTSFAATWQDILRLGLVDDQYPLDHASVQLPNGWYGVNSIIGGFTSVLATFEYDEMLLPTTSVSTIFKPIPDSLKGDIEHRILPITHTGVHKLDAPYYLSVRPDLIIPQIVQITARSYRDLPIRWLQRGFRYVKPSSPVDVSLVTDTEYAALDALGIFATETESKSEAAQIASEFDRFLRDTLKLSTFSTRESISKIWWSVLPGGAVLEVGRLREFGRELAASLDFRVMLPTNSTEPPYIIDFSITSRLFAAVVAAHSQLGRVTLPSHALRAFGTSFGVDIAEAGRVRFDRSRFEFTQERFARIVREGGLFALLPAKGGRVEIRSAEGSEEVDAAEVEGCVVRAVGERDEALAVAERAAFAERSAIAIRFVPKEGEVPQEYVVIGEKEDETDTIVAAKPFMMCVKG
jgi:hypothetical protein